MPTVAVLIVMISAIMHASWNTLARRTDEPYAFFFAINLVSIVIWFPAALLAGWGSSISGSGLLLVSISGGLQVLYFAALAAAYKRGGVTLVYPIARGTGVALVPIIAVLLFGERPTLAGWVGIASTLVGIALLAFANLGRRGRRDVHESSGAILYALITGLIITTYSLFDKFGVERLNPVVYGYGLIVATVLLQTPFVIFRRRDTISRQLSGNLKAVLAGGFLVQGTYILVLIAMTQADVGYVVPLRETSIVFALVLGILVLRESFSVLRVGAAVVVAAGAACIAIGG